MFRLNFDIFNFGGGFPIFWGFLLVWLALPQTSLASEPKLERSSVIKADNVEASNNGQNIKAYGSVELINGIKTLNADDITYNKKTGQIKVNGNIRLKDFGAGYMFAKQGSIQSDFSSGELSDVSMVLQDGSVFKAPKIIKKDLNSIILKKSSYALCPTNSQKLINQAIEAKTPPKGLHLLSIKSSTAYINKEKGTVTHVNPRFRIFNVPIIYSPVAQTLLPSVKRRTGILAPSYTSSTFFGYGMTVPFYVDIAPNKDFLLSPTYYNDEGSLDLHSEWRHLLKNGNYKIRTAFADRKEAIEGRDKEQSLYFSSDGQFSLPNDWNSYFNLNIVSDKDYLRDFRSNYEEFLTSTAAAEKIHQRNYHSIKGLGFQTLSNDVDSSTSPIILPLFNSHIESEAFKLKIGNKRFNNIAAKYYFDNNFTILARENGLQYRRLSTTPALVVPFTAKGNLFRFEAATRGDFYSLEENYKGGNVVNQENLDNNASRLNGRMQLDWTYPLVSKAKKTSILIEPMANLILSSNDGDTNSIPNEDSLATQLADDNLFSNNRFSGYDRIEVGNRANYGLSTKINHKKYGILGMMIGQSYRQKNINNVTARGLNDSRSDYVGRVSYFASKMFDAYYRFRVGRKSRELVSSELNANLNFSNRFRIGGDYTHFLPENEGETELEQAVVHANLKLSKKISLSSSLVRDFMLKRTISKNFSAIYNGCCVTSSITMTQNNIVGQPAERRIMFNLMIKEF